MKNAAQYLKGNIRHYIFISTTSVYRDQSEIGINENSPYGRTAGYQRRSAAKALTKGLTFRPLAVTAKDTLDWHKTRPAEEQAATLEGKINGLSMKREAEVLAAWKEELAKRSK